MRMRILIPGIEYIIWIQTAKCVHNTNLTEMGSKSTMKMSLGSELDKVISQMNPTVSMISFCEYPTSYLTISDPISPDISD